MHTAIAQPCPRTPWTDMDASLRGAHQRSIVFHHDGPGRARTWHRRAGACFSSSHSSRCAAVSPVLGCPRRSCRLGNVLLTGVSFAATGSWQLRVRRVRNGLVIAAYLRKALDELRLMHRCTHSFTARIARAIRDSAGSANETGSMENAHVVVVSARADHICQ